MGKLMTKVMVKDVVRKSISTCGNPSYWVEFYPISNGMLGLCRGYTASNAQCGYTASNFVGKECKVEYHFTRNGTLIIDTMKEVY